MSPTVFRYKQYRFYFFSLEEKRLHVHVFAPDGEAKFWLEPVVALANFHGLTQKQLRDIQKIIEEREDEIKRAWKNFFKA